MRPMKIYLNPKTVGQLTPEMGEGKTMRVRAFKGKDDAEYTDISQVWHEPNDEKPKDGSGIILYEMYEDGSSFIWATWYTRQLENAFEATLKHGKKPVDFWGNVVYWAYIKDLTPNEE